jgi:hypothetical protein
MRALGLKIDNIKPIPLISIMGPNTKNASNEPLVKVEEKDRAKNESTVEHIDTTPANTSMASIELIGPAPRLRMMSRGAKT